MLVMKDVKLLSLLLSAHSLPTPLLFTLTVCCGSVTDIPHFVLSLSLSLSLALSPASLNSGTQCECEDLANSSRIVNESQ